MSRLVPAALALGGMLVASWYFLPHETDVVVAIPDAVQSARTFDFRVTRTNDGAEALRSRRTKPVDARSILVKVKLPRGQYALDVWPEGAPHALQGRFAIDDEDVVDVAVR